MTIPQSLMRAGYAQGLFPMAENQRPEAEIHWYKPRERAVILPRRFHVPRSLAKVLRKTGVEIRWNDDLRAVMAGCRDTRGTSWINAPLIDAFANWPEGYCLSVFQDGQRVGGIYGVQLGALCTAESMFSLMPNASSIALVVLIAGLEKSGIRLIDVQMENAHTRKFQPDIISDEEYQTVLHALIEQRVKLNPDYFCLAVGNSFVQSLSHTS